MMAILLLNASAGENATHWLGEHQQWAWLVLGIIFIHLLMKAVYEKYSEAEQRYISIEKERDALKAQVVNCFIASETSRVQ